MLMEKARELGVTLGATAEFQQLLGAERAFEGNPSAVDLATRVRAQTQALQERQKSGQPIPPESIDELQQLQKAVEENTVIQDLLRAQTSYDKLLAEVNRQITTGLEGARQPA